MRTDKLTSKFQMALADAQSLALGRDHQFIEPAHLMMALLDQQGGTFRPLLEKSRAKFSLLRLWLGEALDRLLRCDALPRRDRLRERWLDQEHQPGQHSRKDTRHKCLASGPD